MSKKKPFHPTSESSSAQLAGDDGVPSGKAGFTGSPRIPAAPSLGAILRMMFLTGATDDMVTSFVGLYQNAASASPLPPIIELGSALHQAARSAGVEVARELLQQLGSTGVAGVAIKQVNEAKSAKLTETASSPTASNTGVAGALPVNSLSSVGSVGSTVSSGEIYRFNVAGRRTSVSLPLDLLESARRAFGGEPGLRQVVQKLYTQAPIKKSGKSAKATNRSAFVRERLSQEIAMSLSTASIPHTELGALH